MMTLDEKYLKLKEYLKTFGSVAVAFSSGVDSTFLLHAAKEALGAENVVAVTAKSELLPGSEYKESVSFCESEGIKQIVIDPKELDVPGFRENPKNRCYLCKKTLFTKILEVAEDNNINAVAEGSNMDDNGDYRPGLIAIEELGIKSPLRFAELTKQDIRDLSKKEGLPTWDKPAFACLASRFVYGETINEERLLMVEKAEDSLRRAGFKQFRVRIHGMGKGVLARIEILTSEFDKIMNEEVRTGIIKEIKAAGFAYVTLDLSGFVSGSMNVGVSDNK